MKCLSDNVNYPKEAKEKGFSGKVFVQFIIDEKGKVTNPSISKSVHPLLDAEAIRVVKDIPNWFPSMTRGNKVKVSYTVPINVKLK